MASFHKRKTELFMALFESRLLPLRPGVAKLVTLLLLLIYAVFLTQKKKIARKWRIQSHMWWKMCYQILLGASSELQLFNCLWFSFNTTWLVLFWDIIGFQILAFWVIRIILNRLIDQALEKVAVWSISNEKAVC